MLFLLLVIFPPFLRGYVMVSDGEIVGDIVYLSIFVSKRVVFCSLNHVLIFLCFFYLKYFLLIHISIYIYIYILIHFGWNQCPSIFPQKLGPSTIFHETELTLTAISATGMLLLLGCRGAKRRNNIRRLRWNKRSKATTKQELVLEQQKLSIKETCLQQIDVCVYWWLVFFCICFGGDVLLVPSNNSGDHEVVWTCFFWQNHYNQFWEWYDCETTKIYLFHSLVILSWHFYYNIWCDYSLISFW